MVAGFIVNQFRGDPSLFDDGHAASSRDHTGWAALGLVPYFADARHACPPRTRWRSTGASRPREARCRDRGARCCRTSPISTISTR